MLEKNKFLGLTSLFVSAFINTSWVGNNQKSDKSDIRSKVEDVKKLSSVSDEKTLVLLHNNGRFSAYGSGSRFGIVHAVLCFSDAAEGLGAHRHGNPVSSEFIQKVNPDIIFIADRSRVVDNNFTNTEVIENLLIKQTKAAKTEKIYYLNPDIWHLAVGGITSVIVMIEEVVRHFNYFCMK